MKKRKSPNLLDDFKAVIVTAGIHEHMIHRFLRERGGSASKKEVYESLGDDADSRRTIDEKLRTMECLGLVTIDGEEVKISHER
ncbi:MAG: hypothetical protein OEZ48_10700 [Candidatus Bathyarchaeota archaeon]|nr:hypothetical protein [Candidatus Bathyarchaeota archaeon]MDH5688313.1 hypothetical protein [Candidatus Bathyarchaeota archaeon]